MSAEEVDIMIERIKNTTQKVVDTLKELEDDRHKEVKSLHKRVTALEYEFARHLEKDNKKRE